MEPLGVRSRSTYVPALDGVRALAVAGVLAFHGGVARLPGGFLGVDAFFVLSGYLITTLLLAEWQRTGRIAVVAFWGRRARRLLPALVLVVVAVAAGGRLLLPPQELRLVRGDGWAALFYVANWRMMLRGGDYFAQTAAPSPLQHTWSLAIEEQFYLVLPLLLLVVLAAKQPARRLVQVSTILAVVSAVTLGAVYRADDPGRAYYSTDTRAAGLLIGVGLAALMAASGREAVPVTGRARHALALLAAAGGLVTVWAWTGLSGDDHRLYSGGMVAAELAVAAVVAHVVLVPTGWSARLLAVPPLVALGRISYGVYLWHWPVFLAADAERTHLQGSWLLALRCLLTLGIATASYHIVEKPIRNGSFLRHRLVLPAAAGAVGTAAALVMVLTAVPLTPAAVGTAAAAATDGIDGIDGAIGSGHSATRTPSPRATAVPHRRRPGHRVRVDVFGDSVAWSLVAYLPPHPRLDIRDRTMLGCGITRTAPYRYFGVAYPRLLPKCRHWPRLWRRAISVDDPDVATVLVGRWETMDRMVDGHWRHVGDPVFDARLRADLRRAISIAGARGAKVLLATEPYNRRGERPDGTLYPEDEPPRVTAWNRLLREVARNTPGVAVLDLGRRVSPEGHYVSSVKGVQIRSDGLHLTPEGVQQWIAPWLLPKLEAALPR